MYFNLHVHRKPKHAQEYVIRNAFLHVPQHWPSYHVSFGIHPWQVNRDYPNALSKLEHALKLGGIALGECGLDRVRGPEFDLQREAFEAQIALANRLNKPLILHIVRSISDLLNIAPTIKTPWIIHGFKGNAIEAETLLRKGARLSFGPRIFQDTELQKLVKACPMDQMYLETDTKPMLIETLYRAVAQWRQIPEEVLQHQMMRNFDRDFKASFND